MIKFIGPKSMFDSDEYEYSTLEECLEYCLERKVLGVDTETTGLDFLEDKVIMLQIGDKETQFVIDTRHVNPGALAPLFGNPEILKVFANAKFDLLMLRGSFGFITESVFDVMLAERILNTGRRQMSFGLSDIQMRRMNVPMHKDTRLDFLTISSKPFTVDMIVYGARDIATLVPIARQQWEECNQLMLLNILDLENEAVLAFADIEFNGLRLDQEAWMELYHQAKVESRALELKLDETVSEDSRFSSFMQKTTQTDMFIPVEALRKVSIKWTSPQQVLTVLRVLIPQLTGVNAKEDLSPHKGKFPLVDSYIAYKEYTKLVTSYGESFISKNVKGDGKIHTSFFQILETGRVSSKGPNMQQIPSDNRYRNCFVPSQPGWKFVSSDFSSQELCIIASGSNDPVWIKALEEGKDLHSVCADLVFGDKWREAAEPDCAYMERQVKCNCKEHKELRNFVKTINFG